MQDSNPIIRFLAKPFMRSLLKLSAYIVVGWNVFTITVFLSLFLFGSFVALLFADSASMPHAGSLGDLEYVYGDSYSLNQLLIIPIKGEIVGDGPADAFSSFSDVTSGYQIKQKLYEAAQRDEVKGVMLAIDSPGGTIYGSRAIADGVHYYQDETKKPVFAHIEGQGASGAYMAAAPAKQIVADYGTEIGSIGIVMGPFKYYDKVVSESGSLLEGGVITQNGIENITLTAGKSKDIGSPYRRLSEEEKTQLQQSINNEYDQFVHLVSQERDIASEVIRDRIGAMIYDPKTAEAHKLIDATASRETTYALLAQTANIKDYQVVQEKAISGFLGEFLSTLSRAPTKKTAYDTCSLTHITLAYHGSVAELCKD